MSESGRPFRLLITGGGTGGHLFPAIAAAQELRQRQPQSEVLFIGTRRKMDSRGLDAAGFASTSIHSYGLKGKNLFDLLKAIAILPISCVQAAIHLRRFRPDVVLGVGGYVTGPVMLAAKILAIPTVIHEQNSIPGLANRQLGRLVDQVCVSLPGSQSYFPAGKTQLTGNPVRQNLLSIAQKTKPPGSPTTLLVLGGSQGAQAINRLVAEAFCHTAKAELASLALIHQTGVADEEKIHNAYQAAGVSARVAAFFHDMAEVYAATDFLVSRAGATTLTELAVLGKPAIVIPYPYAADNHQEENGRYYQEGGGVVQFAERNLTSKVLAEAISSLAADPARRQAMAESLRLLAKPDAARRIIDVCLKAAVGWNRHPETSAAGKTHV